MSDMMSDFFNQMFAVKMVIESDVVAEQTLTKIAQFRKERKRLIEVCMTIIEQYRSKIAEYNEYFDSEELILSKSLEAYFETVDKRKTNTQEAYVLPSGMLKRRYQQPEFVRDEAVLLEWAKKSAQQFIKVKESVDWASLKKDVTLHEGKAVTADGEVIEGVEIVEREPKFVIETDI